ncbi:MAG: aminotransferase class V-fold PLP-dependent enzyme [Thermoproteota archaeon]|nr:aminotransferase class V-fold PLP-dependent enzyme [Thermoproteota archaeon]
MLKKESTAANDFADTELNESIHGDFLITKKKIYLNNGSVGPLPISTIKAITDFNLRYSEQGPDSKEFNDYLDNLKKETRKRVADLINCSIDEIIFTQSTTEGINYITNGIAWNKNDRILLRNQNNEHFSNYLPWIKAANDKNLIIDKFPFDKENLLLEDFKEMIDSKLPPRIVSTSHVMYNDGSISPVEKMGNIIKNTNNKTLFSIDAAQSVGAINVDVKKIKCDFLSFPAFKWICGPLGIGILYVNKKVMDELEPIFVGAGSAKVELKKVENNSSSKIIEGIKFYKFPEKYHSTFRNYPGLAGLESSARYLLRLGISNIYRKNKKLSNIFREEIIKIKDILVHEAAEEDLRSSMICFAFKKNNNNKVRILVEKLQEKGIILAEREIGLKKIVRAAPHFYNTEDEIIKTTNEIKSILNKI